VTDLGDLLGLDLGAGRTARARIRCRACTHLVYVDQAIYGLGRCCAEKAGVVVRRWRLAHTEQAGDTLLDHLPKEIPVEPYPMTPRIDVTGDAPRDAHRRIVDHARVMLTDPTGEHAAVLTPVSVACDDAYRGLIAILERHAPDDVLERGIYCGDNPHLRASIMWPCEDYSDAARGLATGLPN
jgi:hypothetical protein